MSAVLTDPPRTAAEIADGFAGIGVATVHEAQGRSGLMLPHMRPIDAGARAVGTAVTVSRAAGELGLDLYGMREALARKGLRYQRYGE